MAKTVLLLMIVTSQICTGQSWHPLNLNDLLILETPKNPILNNTSDAAIYSIEDVDYIMMISTINNKIDLNDFDLDQKALDEYNRGVIDGLLNVKFPTKLISKKRFNLKPYEGWKIKYTMDLGGLNGFHQIKVEKMFVYIGTNMFTFEIWNLNSKKLRKLKKKFFNSIKVIQ